MSVQGVNPQPITTTAKYLCNICDCVSIGNKGDPLVRQVFNEFPYADCYKDRISTKKTAPGTLQLKGDGDKNRRVINFFCQFYGSSSKYPNDSKDKRIAWFKSILDQLLDMPNIGSLAFPPNLGLYEAYDNQESYRNSMNDFRKKYYLRHNQVLKIVDYYDEDLSNANKVSQLSVDKEIDDIRTEYVEENESQPSITIIQKISLNQLVYVGKSSPIQPVSTQIKPKVGIKSQPPPAPKSKFGGSLLDDVAAETDGQLPIKKASTEITIKKPVPITITPKPVSVTVAPKPIPATVVPKPVPATVVPKPVPVISQPVPKIVIKPQIAKVVVTPEPVESASSMRTYDKNPQWVRSISQLANDIHSSWEPIFQSPKIIGLLSKLDEGFEKEMESFGDHMEILPSPPSLIFNAFKKAQFPPKVIILGQDPYFANANEAMGLSFSVPDGVKVPPSLINIYKELSTDIPNFKTPISGNLSKWADQSVLLLNTALTVRHGQKESHLKLWKDFTNAIIELITQKSDTPIVFMLWGLPAKDRKKNISNASKHLILEATHPSPLGANKGGWFGCKHFSQANKFLLKSKLGEIDWTLA